MRLIRYPSRLPYFLLFVFLVACSTVTRKTLTPPQRKNSKVGCRLEIIINNQRVCLDGQWVLTDSLLGQKYSFRFVRSRNHYILVPVLSSQQKAVFRKRIQANELDMLSVEQLLSIQGMLHNNRFVFEQRNPFSVLPETFRFTFYYADRFFRGVQQIFRSGKTMQKNVLLHRKGHKMATRPKLLKEDGQADF